MREFSMKHMAPDYLVMPFILYNLSKQDREALAGMLPPIITQKLVPIDWKPKWESMKRYLLG